MYITLEQVNTPQEGWEGPGYRDLGIRGQGEGGGELVRRRQGDRDEGVPISEFVEPGPCEEGVS